MVSTIPIDVREMNGAKPRMQSFINLCLQHITSFFTMHAQSRPYISELQNSEVV
jgi:hypothetical protein